MCRHTVVDLAQLFGAAPPQSVPDRLPTQELARLRASLTEAGFTLRQDKESFAKLAKLRNMYEPYLQALSRYLFMELPPWILARDITDNWRTSAWGRISGLALSGSSSPDDHTD
jgi:hypothetical protein